jgi:hypothetical protein
MNSGDWNVRLDPLEITALTKASESLAVYSKPRLPGRYWIFGALLIIYVLVMGALSLLTPVFYIQTMISQSLQPSGVVEAMTRARGLIILVMLFIWIGGHMMAIQVSRMVILLGLVFSTLMSFADLYQLTSLGVFESTIYSSLHLIFRPLIFVTLAIMFVDLSRYTKAFRAYSLEITTEPGSG